MLKLLLVVVVLLLAVAWVMRRGKGGKASQRGSKTAKPPAAAPAEPAQMLACSHCGVHLPRADAAFNAAGQPFCSAEHRVAGPR